MKIIISSRVREKLDVKHDGVSIHEIRECFANRDGKILIESREEHLTNPLTRWFIAETNFGRELKICYMPIRDEFHIKTAYEPDADDRHAYREGNK
ncbi:hypothetical protein [Quatrionicoccus australiensis]|uniref:hypothetical protein n=1 Tax=Quatrionicoccus australiensis TaxID=138118 RepID=UPI001CFBAEDF|nr:hypothetical protein [Quatrionicoccus australiensis]MCB4360910.1 hypothetical protein [Quatrionicoccus australiensis]